jgi:hypothetical protein
MAVCRSWCKLQARLLVCNEVEYLKLPSHEFKTVTRFITIQQSFLKQRTVSRLGEENPRICENLNITVSLVFVCNCNLHWGNSVNCTSSLRSHLRPISYYLLSYALTSKMLFFCTFSDYTFVPSTTDWGAVHVPLSLKMLLQWQKMNFALCTLLRYMWKWK